jgi:lipopolysaccharide transport system ATP-binding protein
MSHSIIKVENLSKKYLLSHQSREPYTTLRDVMANGAKILARRFLDPFNRSSLQRFNDSTEEFFALKDVSFEIQQGDRVGIIGRNGAGKSTLLKILSRITEPTSGRVSIKGSVASLLEVGTGFHPELTGRENIFLNGAILGMTKAEIKRKFDEIVAFAEIEKFLDTPVKRYSSGMYVRLAFAVAAHLEPEILIVDEVLAVGDAQFQKKCLGKMEEVGREGRTVLFVSHNMGAINRLCEKVIVLRSGEKDFYGPTHKGVSKYLELGCSDSDTSVFDKNKPPKTTSAKMLEVGILSGGYKSGTEINTEESIQIYIIFEVIKEQKIGTSVLLYNDKGDLVFSSISNNESTWHGKNRPLGIYRSVCEIPPNFLASGRYHISIPLWEGHYEEGIVEKDVISFFAVENGLVRGDLPYESKGIVRPYFQWTSERLETI